MNSLRLRAEHSAQHFYNKRQNEPVEALAGDGAGNVDVANRLNWIWVRVAGDADHVTTAFNKSGHTFAEDDSILIQWVKRTGLGYYEVTGYSGSVVYDDPDDTTETTVRAHAPQHERRDLGAGGFDPLDVYARMVVPLRARAQTVPNMTVRVEEGPNPLTGKWYSGGSSAAFTVPAGLSQSRWDLLYLGNDEALHVVNGVAVNGSTPTKPDMPLGTVPLAYIYLANGQTTVTEAKIFDARLIVGFVSPTGGVILQPLTDDSGNVLTDDLGNWLYEG